MRDMKPVVRMDESVALLSLILINIKNRNKALMIRRAVSRGLERKADSWHHFWLNIAVLSVVSTILFLFSQATDCMWWGWDLAVWPEM